MQPNFKHPIDEAQSPAELHEVVTRMMENAELDDVLQSQTNATYQELAALLEEEGEQWYAPEFYEDLNNVVYWLQCAFKRLQDLG